MSASHNTDTTEQQDRVIDAAELARTKKRSPKRFKALLQRYRRRGITDREIASAMAASPCIIDAIGRGRQ